MTDEAQVPEPESMSVLLSFWSLGEGEVREKKKRHVSTHWFLQLPSLRNRGSVLYSFTRWSVRDGHKRRQRRGSWVPETGGTALSEAHMEEPQGGPEAENKSEGRVKTITFSGISVGKARRGRVNSLKLASWVVFGRLWAIGVVFSCLVPGAGMIKPARLLKVSLEASLEHPYFKHDWIAQTCAS